MKRVSQHLLAVAIIVAILFALLWGERFLGIHLANAYLGASLLLLYFARRKLYAVLLIAGLAMSLLAVNFTTTLLPSTYDAALWKLDGALGVDPSAWAIGLLQSTPLLRFFSRAAYFCYPLDFAVGLAFSQRPARFAIKLVLTSGLSYLIYCLIPACGPGYFLLGRLATAPRDAMPSNHLTRALLLRHELADRPLGARVLLDVFVIFTTIATVGLGQHYLLDLLVAIPFWLGIEWLAIRLLERRPAPMPAPMRIEVSK
jgi:hypothetical protein